jgi:hypothetical protein
VTPYGDLSQRRKRGCLGCLVQPVLGLLFGGAVFYVLYMALAPWNFYFGGHFHVVPGWTGRGWMHSVPAGGDYYLLLQFDPTTPGYRKSELKGTGYLCAPRGEKFRLHFGGSMPRGHGTDLRGVPIHLWLFNWPVFAVASDRRPSFDLYGTFGDRMLTMDDQGGLARAFRPDGKLVGPRDHWAWKQPSTHVTLEEDSSWMSSATCPVAGK